jgi:hypothetical protein
MSKCCHGGQQRVFACLLFHYEMPRERVNTDEQPLAELYPRAIGIQLSTMFGTTETPGSDFSINSSTGIRDSNQVDRETSPEPPEYSPGGPPPSYAEIQKQKLFELEFEGLGRLCSFIVNLDLVREG